MILLVLRLGSHPYGIHYRSKRRLCGAARPRHGQTFEDPLPPSGRRGSSFSGDAALQGHFVQAAYGG